MKASAKEPKALVVAEIRCVCVVGKALAELLAYAGEDSPEEIKTSALNDLDAVFDDIEALLEEAFPDTPASMGNSRLPKRRGRPLTPQEALEILETLIGLMQVEVENLLNQPLGREEEYKRIADRRDHVIRMMGFMSRYYKGVILYKDPSVWTPEIEKRFEKFLKIK